MAKLTVSEILAIVAFFSILSVAGFFVLEEKRSLAELDRETMSGVPTSGGKKEPSATWSKKIGGVKDEYIGLVQQTSDGGYIAIGDTYSFGTGLIAVKFDAGGDVSWSRLILRGGDCRSMQQTSDGGYIVTGSDSEENDIFVAKLSRWGDMDWFKKIREPGFPWAEAESINQTLDGGYILAGQTYSEDYSELVVIKLGPSGDIIWTKNISKKERYSSQDCQSIRQTSNGEYILSGNVRNGGPTSVFITKLDIFGNVSWSKNVETGFVDKSYAQPTSDGGYILVGNSDNSNENNEFKKDAIVLKFDPSGELSWSKIFVEGPDSDVAGEFIQQTSDGGYLVSGVLFYPDLYEVYLLAFKLDHSGNVSWSKKIETEIGEASYGLQTTSDGGYIMLSTGGLSNGTETGMDTIVSKLDSLLSIPGCLGSSDVKLTSPFFSPRVTSGGMASVEIEMTASNELLDTSIPGIKSVDAGYCPQPNYDTSLR